MPLCQNCKSNEQPSEAEATKRVWCPTWISSQKGPINLCNDCAEVFQPEHNSYARGGSFHWGEEADKAFKQVEQNIPKSDPRYEGCCNMVRRGTLLACERCLSLHVVDGKVWLLAPLNVLCLGNIDEAKETFPALFVKE